MQRTRRQHPSGKLCRFGCCGNAHYDSSLSKIPSPVESVGCEPPCLQRDAKTHDSLNSRWTQLLERPRKEQRATYLRTYKRQKIRGLGVFWAQHAPPLPKSFQYQEWGALHGRQGNSWPQGKGSLLWNKLRSFAVARFSVIVT